MYYNNEIINYLQANKILALKLDHALTGVGNAVSNQIETIGAGSMRVLYYTSCFTDEYQDVCQQQKTEDIRFQKSVFYLLSNGNVVYDMLKIYFEDILKYKTSNQLEHIKIMLMAVNVHIAASSLTNHGFALATASLVAVGMNLSLEISTSIGRRTGGGVGIVGIYGVVQKAADSHRLQILSPSYFKLLRSAGVQAAESHSLSMLIDCLLFAPTSTSNYLGYKTQWPSDNEIADIITKMIR